MWTPLHNAALNGHLKIVGILLNFGADPNSKGFNEETPLHDATANGHKNVVKKLLQYGANPNIINNTGKRPRDIIPKGEDFELMELFEKPLDYWKPYEKAEYYPKLITRTVTECKHSNLDAISKKPSDKKSNSKPDSKTQMFAWGGLEDRSGPFESSREEKKFKKLWQTIAKTQEQSNVDMEEKHSRRDPDKARHNDSNMQSSKSTKRTSVDSSASKKSKTIPYKLTNTDQLSWKGKTVIQ
jgi:hypothetical protein